MTEQTDAQKKRAVLKALGFDGECPCCGEICRKDDLQAPVWKKHVKVCPGCATDFTNWDTARNGRGCRL